MIRQGPVINNSKLPGVRPGGNIKKDSTYYNMADNELDALTANLYVDFLGRRAIADLSKSSKIPELAKVDEASDDQDEGSSRLVAHPVIQPPSDDEFGALSTHKQKDFRVGRGGYYGVERPRRLSPKEEEPVNTPVVCPNSRRFKQKTGLKN